MRTNNKAVRRAPCTPRETGTKMLSRRSLPHSISAQPLCLRTARVCALRACAHCARVPRIEGAELARKRCRSTANTANRAHPDFIRRTLCCAAWMVGAAQVKASLVGPVCGSTWSRERWSERSAKRMADRRRRRDGRPRRRCDGRTADDGGLWVARRAATRWCRRETCDDERVVRHTVSPPLRERAPARRQTYENKKSTAHHHKITPPVTARPARPARPPFLKTPLPGKR